MKIDRQHNNGRRKFIKTGISGAIVAGAGFSGITNILSGCASSKKIKSGNIKTGFEQQPLPYKYDALENVIDALTMEIHYSKHAAAYCKNMKEAAMAENVNMNESLEVLLSGISKYSTKLRNNAGGHFNHEMFWQCMRPKTSDNKPEGNLLKSIEEQFGSFSQFKSQFTDAAKSRFGSGWAWLYKNKEGKLKIGSTANQDNPLMDLPSVEHKGFPILCIDIWEHAYYLKYQNKRADYIENWWNIVNWDYVQSRHGTY
jgi:Fe-Mn family superoxide dismutase